MGASYSGTVTDGVYLTNPATQNPTTITASGYISNSGNPNVYAVSAKSGFAWTVVNQGRITGLSNTAGGIDLGSGGAITNSGTIKGSGTAAVAIRLAAGGTLINTTGGMVSDTAGGSVYILGGAGTVTNAGSLVGGVWLAAGGTVTNQAGGSIDGVNPSGGYGVGFFDSGSVTNAGNITGLLVGAEIGDFKDTLGGSGTVTNESGGKISGGDAGVLLGFPGELSTQGGGSLIDLAGGTISGNGGVVTGGRAATVTNAGLIAGASGGTLTTHGITFLLGNGVWLDAGGVVTNGTGGTITGVTTGVYATNGPGTVTNSGTIEGIGSGSIGVYFRAGGSVTNAGLIDGDVAVKSSGSGTETVANSGTILGTGTHGSGIILDQGGSVGNTGLIEGRQGLSSNYDAGAAAPGIISNLGTILGTAGVGIHLGGGGDLTNQAGGQITGYTGIFAARIGTVTNAGNITGTLITTAQGYPSGQGVFLDAGGVVINQTSGVITGVADGIYLGAAGTVANSGTIVGAIGVAIAAGDTANNTVVNFGTIIGTGGVALSGGAGDVAFVQEAGAQFQGAIGNLHPGDTIDLAGLPFAAGGTANLKSGNVLSIDENGNVINVALVNPSIAGDVFTLSNDGGGGTLISESAGVAPYAISDPLMTNTSGSLVFDQVAGGQIVFTTIGGLGPEWEFDGAGFFLDNGNGNPGFLIRDAGDVNPGALYVGEVVNGAATYTPIGGLGLEWQFEGGADFLGTGQTEFLIRNTGSVEPGALDLGQVVNNAAPFSVTYISLGGLGLEWQFAGSGDFLGDGRQGFLIRNTGSAEPGALDAGEIVGGAVQYTPIGGVGLEWDFEGTGNFLGDGHTGFLIWNGGAADLGAMAIGEVINGQLNFTNIGGVGPEWQFLGTGNYIDSNKTDFLLRNANSGALVVGSVANGAAQFATVGGVGPEWNFHNITPALMT